MFLKFKEFYLSNRLNFVLISSLVLLILSTFWQPIMYVMMAYLLVSMIFMSVQEILCLTFFYLPFSGFLILFIGLSLFSFLIVLTKYIIGVVKKTMKVYKLPLFLTLGIVLVFSCIFYGSNDYGILQGVLLIGIFLYFYLIFAFRKQLDAHKIIMNLTYGLVLSACIGFVLYFIPASKMFIFVNFGYNTVPIRDWIFYGGTSTDRRLQLLNFQVNHLYILCIFIISYLCYFLLKPQKKSKWDISVGIIGIVFALTVGILTLSKTFMVLLALAVLFAIISAFVVYKKKAFKIIIPIIVVCGALVGIFWSKFVMIVHRFFNYNIEGANFIYDFFNTLTTGRIDIWREFLQESASSPLKIIFGVGLFTKDVVDIGPHNFYIGLFYRFGIVGIIALGVLVWAYVRSAGKKLKTNFISIVPLLMFFLTGLQEACMDERLYLFLLGIMVAFSAKSENQVEVQGEANKSEISSGENIKALESGSAAEQKPISDKNPEEPKPLSDDGKEQTKSKSESPKKKSSTKSGEVKKSGAKNSVKLNTTEEKSNKTESKSNAGKTKSAKKAK